MDRRYYDLFSAARTLYHTAILITQNIDAVNNITVLGPSSKTKKNNLPLGNTVLLI